jgi:hypothetical protein
LVKDKSGRYIKATEVISVINENRHKFNENKQEFIVIRWFTEKQIEEENIYGTMASTDHAPDNENVKYLEEQPRHDKSSVDLDSVALYVVGAIVGCICIAFLTVFTVCGLQKKLKKKKINHNTATRQTEEPEVLSGPLADDEKSEEEFINSRGGCTTASWKQDITCANEVSVLSRVIEEETSRRSCSEAEDGTVQDSDPSDVVSVANGHSHSQSPDSDPVHSPSLTPSRSPSLTDTNMTQSNMNDPHSSAASQHSYIRTEKISTPV